VLRPGDRLAGSDNGPSPLRVSAEAATVVDEFEIALPVVTTMVRARGTGFYAIQWGPLPYRFAPAATERFRVRRLDHLVIFEPDPGALEARARALYRSSATLATLLAMHETAWPEPRLPEGDAAAPARALWSRCATRFPRFGDAVAERCLWCSNEEQCQECFGAEADAAGIEPPCTDLLWAALRDQVARCRWTLDASAPDATAAPGAASASLDRICVEAERRWRALVGVGAG